MSSKLIRVMLLAAMATTTAPAAAIAASEHPVLAADAPEVRVVNNHEQRVRVVLVDEVGRHHTLGYVARSKAAVFGLAEYAGEGARVQVKLVVDAPVWSAGNTGEAVRSSTLHLQNDDTVHVWIEPALTATVIEVHR